jgi:hypothetical protein
VKKGDAVSKNVAAASIVAKVVEGFVDEEGVFTPHQARDLMGVQSDDDIEI